MPDKTTHRSRDPRAKARNAEIVREVDDTEPPTQDPAAVSGWLEALFDEQPNPLKSIVSPPEEVFAAPPPTPTRVVSTPSVAASVNDDVVEDEKVEHAPVTPPALPPTPPPAVPVADAAPAVEEAAIAAASGEEPSYVDDDDEASMWDDDDFDGDASTGVEPVPSGLAELLDAFDGDDLAPIAAAVVEDDAPSAMTAESPEPPHVLALDPIAAARSLEERLAALETADELDDGEELDATVAPSQPAETRADDSDLEWQEQPDGASVLGADETSAQTERSLDAYEEAIHDQELPPDETRGIRRTVCVASQAVLTRDPAIGLVTPSFGKQRTRDEIDDALAALSNLQPGQRGFIRLALRPYPEFAEHAREYSELLRGGTPPPPPKKSVVVARGLLYFARFLWKGSAPQSGSALPAPPWQRSEMQRGLLTDQERGQLEDATRKSRELAFWEARLQIGVAGEPEDRPDLETIRKEVQFGMAGFSSPAQSLDWEEADPADAARGILGTRRDDRLVLSATEAAEFGHPPDDHTRPHRLQVPRANVRQLDIPNPIFVADPMNPPPGIIPFGMVNAGTEDEAVIGMRNSELDQHAFISGRTGTGKSVLLEWLVYGIAKSGYPLVLLDPHGTLADNIARILIEHAPERLDDLLIVDFADEFYPVAMNPLDISHPSQIEPTVSAVVEMMERQMALAQSGAPRALNYARQALYVLAEANLHLKDPASKCTLMQMNNFFQDAEFRSMAVEICSNPAIREVYDPNNGPFETQPQKEQINIAAPIERAFRPLSASMALGNVFAAGDNLLDFPRLIKKNKIILVKLSRFAAQKEVSSFVGSLITPMMLKTVGAWGRQPDPDTGDLIGRGCRLIIDEAPTICGPNSSVVEILAEARKWDLGVAAACQFPRQLDPSVEESFYSNTASKFTLALDPRGIGGMARSIAGGGSIPNDRDIVALPNYHAYGNVLLSHGSARVPSGPFSVATLPPIKTRRDDESKELMEKVIAQSRAEVCNQQKAMMAKRQRMMDDIKTALQRVIADRATGNSAISSIPTIAGDYALDRGDDFSSSWGDIPSSGPRGT